MDQNQKSKDPLENSLTGKILLAMPGMGDPRFHRAVIYMCAHDKQGAMGLVINQTLPGMKLQSLLDQIGLASDIEFDLEKISVPVMSGGPVEGGRGFLLHSSDFGQKDTIKVDDNFSISGTVEALKEFASGSGPQDFLFMLGYAGWSAGQLDEELKQNAWLVADADPGIVFARKPEEKWAKALNKMGIDPSMLSADGGRA